MSIKVGDLVVCIDDNCSRKLKVTKEYVVAVVDVTALQVVGLEGHWYVTTRFIKKEGETTNE